VAVSEAIDRFPLFPLGLVLLPSEVVPLHIFEDRYRQMIDECLESGTEFGILWLSDSGLKEIGCTAQITQLLEEMEDGRMNILVQGVRPFRLLRRIEEMAYPAGHVEVLDELESEPDPKIAAGARERYADLVQRVTDTRPAEGALVELDAYGMAATVDFPLEAKQGLLELRSEEERLRTVSELFVATMKRLDHMERVGEEAKSNGKVRL